MMPTAECRFQRPSVMLKCFRLKKTSLPEVTSGPQPPPLEHRQFSTNQRPLPPPPQGSKAFQKSTEKPLGAGRSLWEADLSQLPWFHEVDRKRSEDILRNAEDGAFLLRPSSQTACPLTLTLRHAGRAFHINVRQRPDGRVALGTQKPNEQSFRSLQELVRHHRQEALVLFSGGQRAGQAVLVSWPRGSLPAHDIST